MANGYMGKILWVDLSSRTIKEEPLDEKLCRDYIGGYGLGAKLLFTRQKPGVDPLGPDNYLGFVTGTLTGTPALGGSRYVVVGKSPLTGGWGDANSGGYFGPHLRFSGYDAVFFNGISDKPVYLLIDNGKAELRDAAYLWGKDAVEVDEAFKAEFGKDSESCCIGPSGEKLALIAAVINNKGRAAGRSGVGAIMGSKRLKAIVVRGNQKVPLANAALAGELRKKYLPLLSGNAEMMRKYGTPFLLARCATMGDSPVKNWSGQQPVDFPNPMVENIDAEHVIAYQEKRYACYMCPLGCGGHMKAGKEYPYPAGAHKPEYESLGVFGTNLLIDNVEAIVMANDLCNRYGLDTISAGMCISLAMECYEKGILTKNDTDGIDLTWGNHKAMVDLLEKIGKREGLGNILADGVKVAAEKIGKGAERYAMHIHGQEIPAHDPKFNLNWGVSYHLDPTPARHTQGMGAVNAGLPLPEFDPKSQYGRAPAHKIRHGYSHCIQAAGLCAPVAGSYPSVDTFVDFMNAATGWGMDIHDFVRIGERITNIRQAFNAREGLVSSRFTMPERLIGNPPRDFGPMAGITLDLPAITREYYTEMDWDWETGKPSKKKLLELGMKDVAEAFWP